MNEWPEGWFRDGQSADKGGADPTVSIPVSQSGSADTWPPSSARGQHHVRQYGSAAPPGAWPDQPPARSTGRPGVGSGIPRTPRWWRRLAPLAAAAPDPRHYRDPRRAGGGRPPRHVLLPELAAQPAEHPGQLPRPPGAGLGHELADRRLGQPPGADYQAGTQYRTGFDIGGQRSDTILVLHIPSGGGKPVLISIPRDSYVKIPGYGYNKINAAYSFGGPKLMAETVQDATGLYINHYMGIGFGGFVNVVNAVGGVRMCLPSGLHDPLRRGPAQGLPGPQRRRGARLRPGPAQLRDSGPAARAGPAAVPQGPAREADQHGRDPEPVQGAAGRDRNRAHPDRGPGRQPMGSYQAAKALRGAETTTVPIASATYATSAGDAVLWNSTQAKELFTDLNTGQAVPKTLITGSKQGLTPQGRSWILSKPG